MDLGFAARSTTNSAVLPGEWVLEPARRGWYLCERPIRTEQEGTAASHDWAAGHAAGR
jgi:hypothetical protein